MLEQFLIFNQGRRKEPDPAVYENYLRSLISQERFLFLAVPSIESEVASLTML